MSASPEKAREPEETATPGQTTEGKQLIMTTIKEEDEMLLRSDTEPISPDIRAAKGMRRENIPSVESYKD